MQIQLFIDYIGSYAPIILSLLSIFLLRNMTHYLKFFLYGLMLNTILNIMLKLFIKEPRPSKHQKTLEIAINNGMYIDFDKFGMPSGHAQNCAYNLLFIMKTINDPFITTIYIIITTISLLQRYLFNNHTILQLITGLFVGSGFGYLMYSIGNKFIMGNIKMKKDDYGPF